MLGVLSGLVDTIVQAVDTWVAAWNALVGVLQAFADLGLKGIANAVNQYGPETKATPTTKILGAVYVLIRLAPGFILAYFAINHYVEDRKVALAGAAVYKFGKLILFAYILGTAPPLEARYEVVAFGPMALAEGLGNMASQAPVEAVQVVSAFIVFLALSWVMWYGLNLALYSATVVIRPKPLWSESDAKGHAVAFTLIWVFFLAMSSAEVAFLNTVKVILAILFRRSEFQSKKDRVVQKVKPATEGE